MRHMGCVEGRGDGQQAGVELPLFAFLDDLADRLGVPADDHLVRRVVIADHHAREGAENVGDLLTRGLNRGHGARVVLGILGGRGHRLAAGAGKPEEVRVVQGAGGPQCGEFPEAVPEKSRAAQAQLGKITELADRERPDRRLRVLGPAKSGFLRLAQLRVEDGGRVDDRTQPAVGAGERLVRVVDGPRHGRDVEHRLQAHVQVLAALPGEQRAHLQVGQCPVAEEHPRRMRPLRRVRGCGELLDGQGEQALGALVVRGHEPDPGVARRDRCGVLRRGTGTQQLQQGGSVGRVPDVGPGRAVQRRDGAAVAGVLLENDVEVRPAEAHRGSGGPADRPLRVTDPRAGPGVDVQRPAGEVDRAVGMFHVDGRRQHLVVEGECELHQARRARGTLGVADL